MFSIGIFNPTPSKKSLIAVAAACGRAVKTNTFSVPLFSCIASATSNKGPFLPLITLLNSEKSNLAPLSSKDLDFTANCVAFNLPFLPLGIV